MGTNLTLVAKIFMLFGPESEASQKTEGLEPTAMVRSIKVTVFAFVSVLLMGCGGDGGNVNTREEVISRYSSGEKRVVAIYEGEGVDEQLTERVTFSKSGERVKVENKEEDETKYYDQIHSELSDGDELREFLARDVWVNTGVELDGEKISGIDMYRRDSLYKVVKMGDFARKISYKAEYEDGLEVTRKSSDGEENTSRIYILGPDKIRYSGYENTEGTYKRVEASKLESVAIRESVKELE
jgi:hypothetical protein